MTSSLRSALADHARMVVAFPDDLLGNSRELVHAERAEFEGVLGIPVTFAADAPERGPRWIVDHDLQRADDTLTWNAESLTLTSHVRDASGLFDTLNLLHSLPGKQTDRVSSAPCITMEEAIERIRLEVAGTYPGFDFRRLDWDAICTRHLSADPAAMTFIDLQRWIAELGDAHTAIRRPVSTYNPLYIVEVTGTSAVLRDVPDATAAHEAGVRTGWVLDIGDPVAWLARTGATPQSHAFLAGRRAIALDGVDERAFAAMSPAGERANWIERRKVPELADIWTQCCLDDDTGYIRLRAWFGDVGIGEAFADAFKTFRNARRLILDVRGNTGGSLMVATAMRRCFLRARTDLG